MRNTYERCNLGGKSKKVHLKLLKFKVFRLFLLCGEEKIMLLFVRQESALSIEWVYTEIGKKDDRILGGIYCSTNIYRFKLQSPMQSQQAHILYISCSLSEIDGVQV